MKTHLEITDDYVFAKITGHWETFLVTLHINIEAKLLCKQMMSGGGGASN